jgi:hypothetical protein
MVLRNDGGTAGLGHPWLSRIAPDCVLVAFSFNKADGPRMIAGNLLPLD